MKIQLRNYYCCDADVVEVAEGSIRDDRKLRRADRQTNRPDHGLGTGRGGTHCGKSARWGLRGGRADEVMVNLTGQIASG